MGNNFFTISSFFYCLMLVIVYFRRKHIQSLETRIYSKLVSINFFNVFIAILCYFTILLRDVIPFVNDFISKTLLIIYIMGFFVYNLLFLVIIIIIT